MKQLLLLVISIILGVIVWRIGESLSSDAIGLAVGVVFGVLAGLPTALLVLAGNRREDRVRHKPEQMPGPYGAQPPVIVLATPGMQPHEAAPEPSGVQAVNEGRRPRIERQFQFVGVPEGSDEGWTQEPDSIPAQRML